jgi:hypothetical protein
MIKNKKNLEFLINNIDLRIVELENEIRDLQQKRTEFKVELITLEDNN